MRSKKEVNFMLSELKKDKHLVELVDKEFKKFINKIVNNGGARIRLEILRDSYLQAFWFGLKTNLEKHLIPEAMKEMVDNDLARKNKIIKKQTRYLNIFPVCLGI